MGDFISGLIRLILKFILLLVVVYFGFVVVTLIINDMQERFFAEEETEMVEEKKETMTEKEDREIQEEMVRVEKMMPAPKKSKAKSERATMFDTPRDCVSKRNFKVKLIEDSKYVIAEELDPQLEEYGFTTDLTVVFIAEDNAYYTDQVVKVPRGKCVRQIGVYKSTYFLYNDKTLPIVEIM